MPSAPCSSSGNDMLLNSGIFRKVLKSMVVLEEDSVGGAHVHNVQWKGQRRRWPASYFEEVFKIFGSLEKEGSFVVWLDCENLMNKINPKKKKKKKSS